MSLDLMGADDVGLDMSGFGDIFKSTGELVKGGAELYQKNEAEKKASADDKKNLDIAIAADIAASKAVAQAAIPSATDADKQAAALASSAQDKAGAKLSADSQSKRADAANRQLSDAMAKWKASPNDALAGALVKAWQTTATKAQSGTITSKAGEGSKNGKGGGGSDGGIGALLTKKVIGPVPVWGLGVGGIGAAFLAKKYWLKG
jgi:hypothetical protein